jgi:hypothetical protein
MARASRPRFVGVRATLGGLRDPDTVVEEAIAMRIRENLDEQVGRRVQR